MDQSNSVETGQLVVRLRNRDCKRAMKTYFGEMLAKAMIGGWTECEAAFFLAEVADDHVMKFCKPK